MPVSTSIHVSHCLQYIIASQPASVLDVGCGFGLWGFLCRMYLDISNGRVAPDSWRTRIDGVEFFEPYIQTHQRALYSSIRIGDIRALAQSLDPYDLIIAGDVIEHLDKEEGEQTLDILYQKAQKALMVNIPLGSGWDHPEAYGNPQELHRSQWTAGDFLAYPSIAQSFTLPCGEYGVFYCPKDTPDEARRLGLLNMAQRRADEGCTAMADFYVRRLRELFPWDAEAAFLQTDLLLRRGENSEAARVLRGFVSAHPENAEGALLLAQLLQALGRGEEARQFLLPLFSRTDLPDSFQERLAPFRSVLDT